MAGVAEPAPLCVRMPEPLLEEPPKDRWCDLVLTGGVASGVVYPWAIVELARQFRFRNIGGTSVGALAAAIAAASEYGRRHGHPHAYEVLRQLPIELAEMVEGGPGASDARTRMLSLFQPAVAGRRLFRVFLAALAAMYGKPTEPARPVLRWIARRCARPLWLQLRRTNALPLRRWIARQCARPRWLLSRHPKAHWALRWVTRQCAPVVTVSNRTEIGSLPDGQSQERAKPVRPQFLRAVGRSVWAEYGATVRGWWLGAAASAALAVVAWIAGFALVTLVKPLPEVATCAAWLLQLVGLALALLLLLMGVFRLIRAVLTDLRDGLLKHDLGLCRGTSTETDSRGQRVLALSDWMHEGIQRAAGLSVDGPPLTFEELWHAPQTPGGPRPRTGAQLKPAERSINLEMVTTNVTHGRPYRLPLVNRDTRLFFDPKEWDGFFPPPVMAALRRTSVPYRPAATADPPLPCGVEGLLELPAERLPIVVAARLSLSYPLLFAAVPLYAIDYEVPERRDRQLRRCRFSDGGLSSNFPVHFFDTALPRWPTFGIWLQQRSPFHESNDLWLPEFQGRGHGDNWQRFEPEPASSSQVNAVGGTAGNRESDPKPTPGTLLKFLWAAVQSAKDWGDQTAMRMPHVRRRVVRVMLKQGEGELNIAMHPEMIHDMASRYGTAAGRLLCETYAPSAPNGEPTPAWREHLWVRLQVLLEGLSDLLRAFPVAVGSRGHTLDVAQLLARARADPPISSLSDKRVLSDAQADELAALVDQIERLAVALSSRSTLPHGQRPAPELRLRPPL